MIRVLVFPPATPFAAMPPVARAAVDLKLVFAAGGAK